jgi:hypothetical protein
VVVDPETGDEAWVNTESYAFKKWIKDFRSELETDTQTAFKGGRIESLNVLTREDYGDAVVRFFRARSRRKKS